MAISDTIPSTLQVKTRDQWSQYWLRSYGNRLAVNNPLADISQATAPGSDAWLDAMATADCLAVMSSNAQTIAGTALLANMSEAQLTQKGIDMSVPWPQATGASGYVIAQTSSNGGKFQPGDVCTNLLTRMRYESVGIVDTVYHNGDVVPVRGVDTGPMSNADPNTLLTWDSTRTGTFAAALVQPQTDGTGLTGGADKASVEEYRAILQFAQANESASGNEAAVIKWAQDSLHHGVQVEKAFAYPAIIGHGTMAFCFTIKPATPGGSRVPNGSQLSQVFSYVVSQLPADDGAIICALHEANPTLIGQIDWTDGAAQWADYSPWPNYVSTTMFWYVSAVTDSTHFTVDLMTAGFASGPYTNAHQPSAGMSIAVFDPTSGQFFRKVILTVGGSGPWTIVCDTTGGASDTNFTPISLSTMVSPWSDSMNDVAATLTAYIDSMGPGEQVSAGLGDGRRMLRIPRPTARAWPITIGSKIEANVTDMSSVDSFNLVTGLGATVPVGTPATFSNIFDHPVIALYAL